MDRGVGCKKKGCPMPLGPRSGARGVSKGFGAGGVGGRDTGPREKWRFLKDALQGGGRHKGSGRGVQGLRFWVGGRGTAWWTGG